MSPLSKTESSGCILGFTAYWVFFFLLLSEYGVNSINLNTFIFSNFWLTILFLFFFLPLAFSFSVLSGSDLSLATDVTAQIYFPFSHSHNCIHFVGPCERSSLETEGATCSRDSSSGMPYSSILGASIIILYGILSFRHSFLSEYFFSDYYQMFCHFHDIHYFSCYLYGLHALSCLYLRKDIFKMIERGA